jgi:hypothetical protein
VPGPDLLQRGKAHRFRLDALEEIASQVEAHVGFEQDAPDLAKPLFDRVFR